MISKICIPAHKSHTQEMTRYRRKSFSQYKGQNKPPKVASQGGLTCPRSVAMNPLGVGSGGKTSAARIPASSSQCEELFRCLGQREQ